MEIGHDIEIELEVGGKVGSRYCRSVGKYVKHEVYERIDES